MGRVTCKARRTAVPLFPAPDCDSASPQTATHVSRVLESVSKVPMYTQANSAVQISCVMSREEHRLMTCCKQAAITAALWSRVSLPSMLYVVTRCWHVASKDAGLMILPRAPTQASSVFRNVAAMPGALKSNETASEKALSACDPKSPGNFSAKNDSACAAATLVVNPTPLDNCSHSTKTVSGKLDLLKALRQPSSASCIGEC